MGTDEAGEGIEKRVVSIRQLSVCEQTWTITQLTIGAIFFVNGVQAPVEAVEAQ